ncbi:hypothetical protein FRB93_001999 [Tulasnella sp. JGI-2019a]|nr:hypothetical protein FRB93_001999 [Tulasnella sp. JGI-2019a]
MPRTLTKTQNTLSVTLPEGSLSFTFPTTESDIANGYVIATIPSGSRVNTGYHWHETHSEFHKVLSGRALITLDGITREYTPQDDEIVIRPFVKHLIRRADAFRPEGELGDREDLEWDICIDRCKRRAWADGAETFVQGLAMFSETDMYPVVTENGPTWFGRYATYAMILLGVILAKVFGIKGIYDEYTPGELKATVGKKDA